MQMKVKLGEIANIQMGQSPSSSTYNNIQDGLPFYQGITEFNEKYVIPKTFTSSPIRIADENDILFSVRAPVGEVNITRERCCIGRGNASMRMKNGNQEYLYYLLKANKKSFLNYATGSVFESISGAELKNFELNIEPDEKEQKRISNILSSFDNKIELLRKENNTLEDIAQSIFKEWFVKYNFPNKDGKPYRDNNGKMIDSELGLIPEGWRVGKLGEIFDFLEGPGIRNWQYATTGYPFINIRLLTDDHDIDIKNCNFISQEDALGKYKHFQLKEKDFVLSTSGTLGKYAIVRQNHLPLMLNTSVIRFRPKQDIPHSFLYLTLSSKRFLSELQSLAGGSVQLNFGPVHLKQINTLIPDNCTLKLFGNNLDRIYDKIANNKNRMIITKKTQNVLLKEILS